MNDKRQFTRYECKLPMDFDFFEGNPDEINTKTSVPLKGKAFMLDISKGGVFLVTNARVGVNIPIILHFEIKKKKYDVDGHIIRTGLLKNNPSDIVKRYANAKVKGDSYIAVQFDALREDIDFKAL